MSTFSKVNVLIKRVSISVDERFSPPYFLKFNGRPRAEAMAEFMRAMGNYNVIAAINEQFQGFCAVARRPRKLQLH